MNSLLSSKVYSKNRFRRFSIQLIVRDINVISVFRNAQITSKMTI